MNPNDRRILAAILALDWSQPCPIVEWCKANPREREVVKMEAKPVKNAKQGMFKRGAA